MTDDRGPFPDTAQAIAKALEWRKAHGNAAMATVVSTWGSSPRPAGSRMAVSPQTDFVGSVSGGCIEGEVIGEALKAMRTGSPADLAYGINEETAQSAGLACGGTVRVFVEPLGDDTGDWERALSAVLDRRPCALATSLVDGAKTLLSEDTVAGGAENTDVAAGLREVLENGGNRILESGGADYFLDAFLPPLRLVIVGAVHIAEKLAEAAKLAEYAVSIIDPRTYFATADRFPDVDILTDWPSDAVRELAPDRRTAVVTLTHDSKLDDPALEAVLKSDAFYVGSLGSRRTHEKRLERLRNLGFEETDLARIHAPVGLDIGAKSPAEIAIAIMAEVIAADRSKKNA